MLHCKKKPSDVFTPRRSTVNEAMYVPRPYLEEPLTNSAEASLNLVIHGESGSGKTWLYRHVLKKLGYVTTLNLGRAAYYGDFDPAFQEFCGGKPKPRKSGFKRKRTVGLSKAVAEASLERETTYELPPPSCLRDLLTLVRKRARRKSAFLVLENFEQVRDDDHLMTQLGNLIVLLDDEEFGKFGVKLVLVGTASDLRRYFRSVKRLATVANRLHEVPQVRGFSVDEVVQLTHKGFVEQLGVRIHPIHLRQLARQIHFRTAGLPQYVHEYCQCLARHVINSPPVPPSLRRAHHVISRDSTIDFTPRTMADAEALRVSPLQIIATLGRNQLVTLHPALDRADHDWSQASLSEDYTRVQEHYRSDPDAGGSFHNQVLWAISVLDRDEFDWRDVYHELKRHFPKTTQELFAAASERAIAMRVGKMLEPFVNPTSPSDAPLLTRVKPHTYALEVARVRLCLRTVLRKGKDEGVQYLGQEDA